MITDPTHRSNVRSWITGYIWIVRVRSSLDQIPVVVLLRDCFLRVLHTVLLIGFLVCLECFVIDIAAILAISSANAVRMPIVISADKRIVPTV
ncbi:hypothetical protein [Terriglobus sp. RCC_193]|uniref:hypothetical protein n=1 Tax=Terriglobus sp. RCC_193 TaxID=3239218 RepID=UPI003524E1DA